MIQKMWRGTGNAGAKEGSQKKAAAAAPSDGADSDEDWSRGSKASKGKKGGKAKKPVRVLPCRPCLAVTLRAALDSARPVSEGNS